MLYSLVRNSKDMLQLVVQGNLQSSRAAVAARLELQAMQQVVEQRQEVRQLWKARLAAEAVQERQLRQNLQEDVRHASGERKRERQDIASCMTQHG